MYIPDASVVYIDPPYKKAQTYAGADPFDHEAFYDWCAEQTAPLFISEYRMPEDRFRCIAEFDHRSTLSATKNNPVKERVFVPIHQDYVRPNEQLTMFD